MAGGATLFTMRKPISRLARFEERRAYRRIIFSVLGTIIILVSFLFLGIPALREFSLFMANLRGGSDLTTQDTTPPYTPRLEAPYTATNSATITISGYAEPNTSVEIFLNGLTFKKILIGNDGNFILPNINLSEGENKITAQAKDAANNQSQPADPLIIIYKKTPPKLEITQPNDGENFSGENKNASIVGLTDTETTVTVNNRFVMVKNDGSFSYSYPLNSGENLSKIIATDKAGNQTTVEKKVNYSP